jgi:ribosomal protein S18 acetylase RimI-like enzyme
MAIKFYQNNGFTTKEKHEAYYKSLAPDQGKDAIVLEKLIERETTTETV